MYAVCHSIATALAAVELSRWYGEWWVFWAVVGIGFVHFAWSIHPAKENEEEMDQ